MLTLERGPCYADQSSLHMHCVLITITTIDDAQPGSPSPSLSKRAKASLNSATCSSLSCAASVIVCELTAPCIGFI